MNVRSEKVEYVYRTLERLAYETAGRNRNKRYRNTADEENFFCELLNIVFNLNLINVNEMRNNENGIDLADSDKRIAVQVTATASKSKIKHTLDVTSADDYDGYEIWFVFTKCYMEDEINKLKTGTYSIPNYLRFDPQKNIYDVYDILNKIEYLGTNELDKVYAFLKKSCGGGSIDIRPSDILKVIKILANADLFVADQPISLPANILDKIKFNDVPLLGHHVHTLGTLQHRVDEVYSILEREVKNSRTAILHKFSSLYIKENSDYTGDRLYFRIKELLVTEVAEKLEDDDIMSEEIVELCVDLLIVNAFTQCKIFEKPISSAIAKDGNSIHC